LAFEAIRKNSAPEMVAAQILKKIAIGEIASGTRLPSQRELAERFKLGRSSIREAINALAVMGYLDVQQGRGTFVAAKPASGEPSVTQLRAALRAGSLLDVLEVREALECRAAALAAERGDSGQLRRLKRALQAMESDFAGDYRRFLDADVQFHQALAQATANPIFSEMLRLLLEKLVGLHQALRTGELSPAYRERSVHTLRQVLGCIEKEDGPGAARAMQEHLNAIRHELKDIL
jgi:GntR family transcriptional repressor for pyruvate dehydrogenase complex